MRPVPMPLLRPLAALIAALPSPLARAPWGFKPKRNHAGMELDPRARVICAAADRVRVPLSMDHLAQARTQLDGLASLFDVHPPEVAEARAVTIPGPAGPLPARLYLPLSPVATPLPCLVYYHGGGFVEGGLTSHDPACRRLTAESGCAVLAIDYRLAPEARFPAAVEDAEAAFRWVVEHGGSLGLDPRQVAVGGDSAGGNLAAVVCQIMRDRGGPHPLFQLLIYPMTDAVMDTPSHEEFRRGLFLDRRTIDFFLACYLNHPDERLNPRVSPLRATDLRALPDALVITAGFDPLRDEGKAYAEALRMAGASVAYRVYEGMVHGFINMAGALPDGARALTEAAHALRGAVRHRGARGGAR